MSESTAVKEEIEGGAEGLEVDEKVLNMPSEEENPKIISDTDNEQDKSRKRVPKGSAPPGVSLEEAITIARKIYNFPDGEAPYSASQDFMGNSSNSSVFTKKLTSLRNYGIVDYDDVGKVVSLTELGVSIVAPTDEAAQFRSLKQAFLRIELFFKLHEGLKGRRLPQDQYILNTIANNVPRELADTWLERFKKSIRAAHLIETRDNNEEYVLENARQVEGRAIQPPVQDKKPPLLPLHTEPTRTPIPLGMGRNAYLELPPDWDMKKDLKRFLKMIEIALNPDYDVD